MRFVQKQCTVNNMFDGLLAFIDTIVVFCIAARSLTTLLRIEERVQSIRSERT